MGLQQGQGKFPAQGGINGGEQLAVAGGVELFRAVPQQFEGKALVGQGLVLHHGGGSRGLGAVLFHEFHAGGRVVEQIADGDDGALGAAALLQGAGDAGLQAQPRAHCRAPAAGGDLHPGHGGNGGQGFAAEAQGADGGQILRRAQLGGGVAQEGGGQLLGGDAAAVIADADQAHAAAPQFHGHGGGPGVDGVFQQFLDHAGGPFHHLAGGDHIRQVGRKLLNQRHRRSFLGGGVRPGWSTPPGR